MAVGIFNKIKEIRLTGKNIVKVIVIILIAINLIVWIRMPSFGRTINGQLWSNYNFMNKTVETVGEKEIVKLKYGSKGKYFHIVYNKEESQYYKVILKNGREFENVYGDMAEIINGESVPIDVGEIFENEMGLLLILQAIEGSDGVKSGTLVMLILMNAIGGFLALNPTAAIAFRNLGMFKSYEPSDFNIYGTVAAGFFIIIWSLITIMRF